MSKMCTVASPLALLLSKNYPFFLTNHDKCSNKELPQRNLLDLVTIAFNNSNVIEMQIRFLKKNLADSYFYTVCDNSTDSNKQKAIREVCRRHRTAYLRIPAQHWAGFGPSVSHGSALTWVWRNYLSPRKAVYVGFLDHDIFPLKKISIVKNLKKYPVYGLIQERGDRWYLWPGFSFFCRDLLEGEEIDFLPGQGLDTGGGNWSGVYQHLSKHKLPKIRHSYARISSPSKRGISLRFEPLKVSSSKIISNLIERDKLVEFIGDWCHTFNASTWRKGMIGKDVLVRKALEQYVKK